MTPSPPSIQPTIEKPSDHLLQLIQQGFEGLVRMRAANYIDKFGLAIPTVSNAIGKPDGLMFRVPGMGYFHYAFYGEGEACMLIAESAYTQISGSGQRHRITAQGTSLIEENF